MLLSQLKLLFLRMKLSLWILLSLLMLLSNRMLLSLLVLLSLRTLLLCCCYAQGNGGAAVFLLSVRGPRDCWDNLDGATVEFV